MGIMETIIYYLLLTVSLVYVTDLSGVVWDVSERIWKWRHKGEQWRMQLIGKPWSCSMCQVFWTGLIMGTLQWNLIWGMFMGSIGAILSIGIKNIIKKIIEWLNKI